MRGRAEVARRAHNPEVPGSNPGPATQRDAQKWAFLVLKCANSLIYLIEKKVFVSIAIKFSSVERLRVLIHGFQYNLPILIGFFNLKTYRNG
jgi:hypothetical protein